MSTGTDPMDAAPSRREIWVRLLLYLKITNRAKDQYIQTL